MGPRRKLRVCAGRRDDGQSSEKVWPSDRIGDGLTVGSVWAGVWFLPPGGVGLRRLAVGPRRAAGGVAIGNWHRLMWTWISVGRACTAMATVWGTRHGRVPALIGSPFAAFVRLGFQ